MGRQSPGKNTGRKQREATQTTEQQLTHAINHFESTSKPTTNYDKNRGHFGPIVAMAADLGIISKVELTTEFNAPQLLVASRKGQPTDHYISHDDRLALVSAIKQRLS